MRVAWKREAANALPGAIVGLLAFAAFLVAHAFAIEPIFSKALSRAPIPLLAGALVGVLYPRIRPALPGGAFRGVVLGGLVALTLVPFLAGGVLRHAGESAAVWMGATAGLLALVLLAIAATLRAGPASATWTRPFALVVAAALAVNAIPFVFLLYSGSLVDLQGRAPNPFPIAASLASILLGSGLAIERLSDGASPRSA